MLHSDSKYETFFVNIAITLLFAYFHCCCCLSITKIVLDSVEDRVFRAMAFVVDKKLPLRSLVVVGGVAANLELRR